MVQDSAGGYIVKSTEPAGQADVKGIRIGDRVQTVDSGNVSDFKNVRKYGSIEGAHSVKVLHPNQVEQTIYFQEKWIGDHSNWELLIQFYIPGLSLIIFTAFSMLLYSKRGHDKAALLLIVFFMSIGLSYYGSSASYRSDPVGLSIIYIVLPCIPLLFMSFMNIYLQKYYVRFVNAKVLAALYAMSAILTLVSLLYFWTDLFSIEVYNYMKMVHSAIILLGNLLCVFNLFYRFFEHRKSKLNSLFKITLMAHLVAFTPFTIMNLLPLMTGYKQFIPAAFTALFLFVLPIVYLYLLTSNQLFDIDFILTRFKYYTSLSFVPSLLISIFVLALMVEQQSNHFWTKTIQLFAIIYISITLFLYIKELIDHRFRPRMFKAMYSYQDSLDRFSRKIARIMKKTDLQIALRQEINELLPVNQIEFIQVDQIEGVTGTEGQTEEEKRTIAFLLQISDILQVGEMVDLPSGLGLVIGKQRSSIHVVWIGPKTNHTRFNSDELRWLKTMANYASIVFENLYLVEGLIDDLKSEVQREHTTSPWILRLLFTLSENERRKLAADLHDSALQDQLLWYRKLESVMIDHPMSDKLNHELEDIKEGLLDVIHQIRETCNELRPPLLKEMGVVEAIESIIEHAQMRDNFAVDFRAKPFAGEQLNEEQITVIYRIVQELLRNASKHARANLVKLELDQRKGYLYLNYSDDGIGMDVHSMEASFEHMGLSGIKERVASLEGSITFRSEKGKGLEVTIVMPETMTSERQ
ncbi:ATP-binding protein [Paenibacillus protaetiae]|uniref:histidine kinase n=1 Tax=Paenibacillus protaetiae TaxID=2509456 RepID=A0A4P6EV47_9BACL|nr:ATP-binding protein [Paenibacillus protaetiae]QAY66882.1 hypothetical protein ET464_11235 [Paenibacillus protaetiae]